MGATEPLVHTANEEAPNPLRQYVGVLRRRWLWVVLGLVLGLVAGMVSTLLIDDPVAPQTYYKATNTLIATDAATTGTASGTGTGSLTSNLPQTALLVRSAEVLGGVASQLGLDPGTVADQVTAVAVPEVSAIDVTAISDDPGQAVALADTAAKVLSDRLATEQQRQYTTTRDSILARLDELTAQRDQLQAALVANPADATIQAQLASAINQYSVTYADLQGLASTAGTAGGLSSLRGATPVAINGRGYRTRLAANRDARSNSSVADTQAGSKTTNDVDETNLSTPAPVSKRLRVAIGAATGLVLGVITAFLIEAWDDRLRRRQRTEAATGLHVIAEVPILTKAQRREANAVVVIDSPNSRAAESYRSARSAVLFILHRRAVSGRTPAGEAEGAPPAPVLMITSPSPNEGKTTTAANIAAALGDTGLRTLVVDCDYHNPKMGGRLAAVVDPRNLGQPSATRLPNVSFVPAPPADGRPAEIIAVLRQTIERWRPEFDVLVLDTPPMLATNDAIELLDASSATVLVVRAGQTRTGPATRASQMLSRYSSNVLGVILNGCSASEIDDGYGYGYSYGYYTDETPRPRSSAALIATDGGTSPDSAEGTADRGSTPNASQG